MSSFETLKIDLQTVTKDEQTFTCTVGDDFFQSLSDAEIHSGCVNTSMSIRKAVGDVFTLKLCIEGNVIVPCDLCLEDMQQPVSGESIFYIKTGKEEEADDNTIMIAEGETTLDVTWIVYETIALAVPIKHVHAPGKCNAAMTDILKELSAARSGDETADSDIDPRWAGLMKLKQTKSIQ